jgi:hypothetical protein
MESSEESDESQFSEPSEQQEQEPQKAMELEKVPKTKGLEKKKRRSSKGLGKPLLPTKQSKKQKAAKKLKPTRQMKQPKATKGQRLKAMPEPEAEEEEEEDEEEEEEEAVEVQPLREMEGKGKMKLVPIHTAKFEWAASIPLISEKSIFNYLKRIDPQFHGCLADFTLNPTEWSDLLRSDEGPLGRFSDGATVMVGDEDIIASFNSLQMATHFVIRGLVGLPKDPSVASTEIAAGLSLAMDALSRVSLFLIREAGGGSDEQKQRAAIRDHVPRGAKAFLDDPSFFQSGAGGTALSGAHTSGLTSAAAASSSTPAAAPPPIFLYPITVATPPTADTRVAIPREAIPGARTDATATQQARTDPEPQQQQQVQQQQPLTPQRPGPQAPPPSSPGRSFPLAPPAQRSLQPRATYAPSFPPSPRGPFARLPTGPRQVQWRAGEGRQMARTLSHDSSQRATEDRPRSSSAGRWVGRR